MSDASVAGLSQALGVEPSQAGSLIQQQQIGSTEIRCKLSLLSKIIEPNSLVDILTEYISLSKKIGTPKQKQLHVPRLHLISPKIKVEQYIQFCPSNLLRR